MNKTTDRIPVFWKVFLVILGIIALSSGLIKSPGFWSSYVLDIAGPAWIYILIRGQYSGSKSFLSLKLSPEIAVILIIVIGVLIELSQYYKLYTSTYDPYDFIAYASLLIPVYLLDKCLNLY